MLIQQADVICPRHRLLFTDRHLKVAEHILLCEFRNSDEFRLALLLAPPDRFPEDAFVAVTPLCCRFCGDVEIRRMASWILTVDMPALN